MATIYRFIVEQKGTKGSQSGSGGTKPRATKGAAKKGRSMPLFGGSKGGVEHNRWSRAINPLVNKVTGGVYEKGVRISRALGGLVKINPQTGKFAGFSGSAITIIIAFVLMTVFNAISKINQGARQKAERLNAENYKVLENGGAAIHGAYKIMVNSWSGRITYNENK